MTRIQVVLRCFVLASMMLSFGESVWASTCAAMSMTSSGMAAAEGVATSDMAGMPMPGTPMPGMPMPVDGEQQGNDARCPLGPAAAAQGCVTAVAPPASAAESAAALSEREGRNTFEDAPIDLLRTTTLFHPPRG